MPTYQKPPTVNDDARAQDIYREAARIISEQGFDATSMGDIADTVDLTKGGLYYYIKGKKALLYAIMNFALDELEKRVLSDSRQEEDAEKRLAGLLSGYVRVLLDESDSMQILVSEEERLDPSYRPRIVERKRAYADYLSECIAEVLDARDRDTQLDPAVAAYSILGMIHSVVSWYLAEGEISQDELIDQIREMALRGLVPMSPGKGPARKTRARRRAVA